MCLRESPPRVVRMAFPSWRGDCAHPQTAPMCSPTGMPRVRLPRWGGTHPKRGDPTGTKSSSASDCVDRRGGTLIAGRYGVLCPGKAGGPWTCRPDILESTQHTAGRRLATGSLCALGFGWRCFPTTVLRPRFCCLGLAGRAMPACWTRAFDGLPFACLSDGEAG